MIFDSILAVVGEVLVLHGLFAVFFLEKREIDVSCDVLAHFLNRAPDHIPADADFEQDPKVAASRLASQATQG